jgi:5-methylthioadenosine/S-adenosylhomocysteine deaminase
VDAMSLVISGQIVPLSANAPGGEAASFQGKVWIGDDGRIAAVTSGANSGPPGFANATQVNVGTDLVVPGFIDLHSHLGYATLPLWTEPTQTTPFLHHNSWPKKPSYPTNVTWPAYAFIEASPAELLAYAEVRALIGGTTSIQGSPPQNRPLDGRLVRNVEDERLGGLVSSNQVLSSTLTLDNKTLAARADQMKEGAVFIYHCAEGQPGSVVTKEYKSASDLECLQKNLVAIHTNAIDPASYGQWNPQGTIVWSPFSNLWLYGTTTDVPAAIARNIRVCIGSDWGPSGTRNVLGELKVASLVVAQNGWNLQAFDLIKMITANPGDVIRQAWNVQAGRLETGALGDVTVIAGGAGSVFKTILEATEHEVKLVVINGKAVYGETPLMNAAGATPTPLSVIQVDGQSRSLALARFDAPAQAWKFSDVLARLEEVRNNPKDEIEQAQGARHRGFANLDPGDVPPLRLALDMPIGVAPIGGLPKDLSQILVPPIQPLFHDSAFFSAITPNTFHQGILDGLKQFYS